MHNGFLFASMQYYRQDADSCTVGLVTAKGEYREKTNFYIELDTFVDSENAGYFVFVTRKSDGMRK